MHKGCIFSTSLPVLVIFWDFDSGFSNLYGVTSLCFWFAFLKSLVILNIFSYTYWSFVCLLNRNVYSTLAYFWLDYLRVLLLEFFCILDINPLSDKWLRNIFSHYAGWVSVCWFFCCAEGFKFDVVPFAYFSLGCLCFWCHTWEIIAKSSVMKLFPYVFF